MQLAAGSAGKFIDEFSREFEAGFMDILKRRFRSQRVHANMVYNEYIRDRDHTHMNATRWVTLTGFILYLGKTGKCKVEETPKGWYLTYIEKDPELLAKQERASKKEKSDMDEEERLQKEIEERVKKAQEKEKSEGSGGKQERVVTALQKDEDTKIAFSFAPKVEKKPVASTEDVDKTGKEEERVSEKKANGESVHVEQTKSVNHLEENSNSVSNDAKSSNDAAINKPAPKRTFDENVLSQTKSSSSSSSSRRDEQPKKRKLSALEEIKKAEEQKKDRFKRTDYWLVENIVVKVLNKKLGDGKYYKQKGVVTQVIDKYIAVVKMLDVGDVIKIDQQQLETVIPAIGGKVLVVNGAYRGSSGILLSIDVDKFMAEVRLESGGHTGSVISFPYEDICKVQV
jgi:DNA/RNA-binding protein KIN17